MVDYELIGRRIKEARNNANLTQEKLGEKLDKSTEYISRIEVGKAKPNLLLLSELAVVLDTKIEYLIAGTVIESPDYLEKEFSELLRKCEPKKKKAILQLLEIVISL